MACKCRNHAGFDSKSCTVLNLLAEQSPDIAQAVHVNKSVEELGAGDQVRQSMFSYIVPTLYVAVINVSFCEGIYVWLCK